MGAEGLRGPSTAQKAGMQTPLQGARAQSKDGAHAQGHALKLMPDTDVQF